MSPKHPPGPTDEASNMREQGVQNLKSKLNWWREEDWFVLLLACIPAIVLAVLYFWNPKWGDAWQELRPNLFSEALGIVFTVVVIDQLLKATDRRKTRLARFSAYDEARVLCYKLRDLWVKMTKAAASNPHPDGLDLFDQSAVDAIHHLNLHASAPVWPPGQPWRHYLHTSQAQARGAIERVIQRYITFTDQRLVAALREIENSPFLAMIELMSVYPRFPVIMGDIDQFFPLRRLQGVLCDLSAQFKEEVGFHEPPPMHFDSKSDQLQVFGDARI